MPSAPVHIRLAGPADAARVADFARRIAEDPQRYPMLVAESEGTVIGWAGISAFRPRKGYEGIGELSISLDKTARGRGVGKQLLSALITAAAERNGGSGCRGRMKTA